jgi:hypothetical protein
MFRDIGKPPINAVSMTGRVTDLGTLGDSNRLMTLREVADVLDHAPQTVYNRWRAWGLPFYRPGGAGRSSLRIRERDFWAWCEKRAANLRSLLNVRTT